MIYKFDKDYVRRKMRSEMASSFIMLTVIGLLVANHYSTLGAKPDKEEFLWIGVILLIGIFALSIKRFRDFRKWATDTDSFSLEITEQKLITRTSSGNSEINIDAIDKLSIQKRGESAKTLLVRTKSGALYKFEGFLSMELLAKEVSDLLPKGKVKVAKWFHR
jgi:hypothetical protein